VQLPKFFSLLDQILAFFNLLATQTDRLQALDELNLAECELIVGLREISPTHGVTNLANGDLPLTRLDLCLTLANLISTLGDQFLTLGDQLFSPA